MREWPWPEMAFSPQSDFDDKILFDIEHFVETKCDKSVLVFPAVNSYCRFVIHQLIQTSFKDYFTFSIGQDPNRRIVVCPKNILSSENDSHPGSEIEAATTAQPTIARRTMVVGPDETIAPTQAKKSRTVLPTAQIYRPPAARKFENEIKQPSPTAPPLIVSQDPKPRARIRRPDIQVYVPRAKRLSAENANSKPTVEGSTNFPLQDGDNNINKAAIKVRSSRGSTPSLATVQPRASALVETKKKLCQSASSSDLEFDGDCNDRVETPEQDTMADVQGDSMLPCSTGGTSLPPRAAALVEVKKRLCQTNNLQDDLESCHKSGVPSVQNEPLLRDEEQEVEVRSDGNNFVISDPLLVSETLNCAVIDSGVTIDESLCNSESQVSTGCSEEEEVNFSEVDVGGEVLPNNEESVVEVGGGLELPLYSSGYTSDGPPSSESGSNHSLSSIESCDVSKSLDHIDLDSPTKTKQNHVFNPDECEWDDLFDENGECLDPFLMKELAHAVGEVRVARPQSDYKEYRSQVPGDGRSPRRPDEDFGHVLEIYSFPPEFKTQDLMAVFLPFKNTGGGFEIKWVDDTHALGVFASSLVAAEVLQYRHPLVRTRPLSEGILESRLKARRLSESIQSFKPRPATCAALARRLVTGALGVKLKTARQEREEEKKVLQEARERRRLAAKQRDEIWND